MVVDNNAFASLLKEATHGRSVRSLAAQTGWGRSTVHEWLVGIRLPSAQQLQDLLGAVEPSPQLMLEIERLRSAAAHAPDPGGKAEKEDRPGPSGPAPGGTDTPPDGTGSAPVVQDPGRGAPPKAAPDDASLVIPRRGVGRPILAGVLVLVALAAFAGGFATGRTTRSQPSAGSTLPQARVQGTLGRGLFSHRGPDGATERVGSLYEGQVVHIACISPTGSLIEDDTMHQARDDWALLSDGTWVSVLYLDVHDEWTPPQPPPPPLTIC